MLAFGQPILIGGDLGPHIRLRNFDAPEQDFAWSTGRWCEVEFDLDLGRGGGRGRGGHAAPVTFLVDLDAFRCPPVFTGQNVLTYLNGSRVHSAFVSGRRMLSFAPRGDVLVPGANLLTFDLPDAIRPLEFGLEDNRMLGVQVFSIAIEPAG
jgi:hypothetical protein